MNIRAQENSVNLNLDGEAEAKFKHNLFPKWLHVAGIQIFKPYNCDWIIKV